jgi:hypothetical protein
VDQNDVNASHQNQIRHLEDVVTELVDRIFVLEKIEKNAKANDTTCHKPARPPQTQQTAELTEQVNDLTIKVDCYLARMEDLETIVEQLNDPSTQHASNAKSPNATAGIMEKIASVEKQLHAGLGERHQLSINGAERSPSLHELANTVERHRKRLKLVEDMEGLSKCARTVR